MARAGGCTSKMVPLYGDWQVGSVLCHVDFTEQLITQQLTSQSE